MFGIETNCLALFGLPGGSEWIVIAILGLLIFGRRLPEVGRGLGKSIVEFKKGLKGIEEDIDTAGDQNQADMLPPPEESTSGRKVDEKSAEARPTGESVSQTKPT